MLDLEVGSARRPRRCVPDSDFPLASANRLALDILCGRSGPSGVPFFVRRGFVSRRFGARGMLVSGMTSESWMTGSSSGALGFWACVFRFFGFETMTLPRTAEASGRLM